MVLVGTKNRRKWAATIVFKGKTYHLGRYHNIEDAAAVRKEAEDALFGDFLKWFQEVYPERWEKFNKRQKRRSRLNPCFFFYIL